MHDTDDGHMRDTDDGHMRDTDDGHMRDTDDGHMRDTDDGHVGAGGGTVLHYIHRCIEISPSSVTVLAIKSDIIALYSVMQNYIVD